jgi:hypothetical protein
MGSKDGRYVIPEAWLKDPNIQKRIRVLEKRDRYKIFLVMATIILLMGCVLICFKGLYK